MEEPCCFIWVGAGEPEQVDPSTIPVLEWHDNIPEPCADRGGRGTRRPRRI